MITTMNPEGSLEQARHGRRPLRGALIGALRALKVAAALVCGLTGAALAITWATYALSATVAAYAVALVAIAVGLLSSRLRRLLPVGIVFLAGTLAWRAARGPARGVEVATWPDGGSRIVNRLFEERDGTLAVGALLRSAGVIPRDESRAFLPGLRRVYAQMDGEVGGMPSPAIATYLGLQSPTAFDTVIFRPAVTRFAIVFLHGYAGNYAVYCWVVARAALPLGGMTVCPSVGPEGRWWSAEGARTLKASIAAVKRQGIDTIVLGGLSNGGLGASRLAPRFRQSLSGLMLISGCDPDASAARLPTLVVQGGTDSMMPASYARACALRDGAAYAEIASGHFMLIDHDEELVGTVRGWLAKQFGPAS